MSHTVVVGSQACVRDTPEWHQTHRQRSSDEVLITVSIGIILLRRIVHTVAGLVSRGVVLLSDDKKYLKWSILLKACLNAMMYSLITDSDCPWSSIVDPIWFTFVWNRDLLTNLQSKYNERYQEGRSLYFCLSSIISRHDIFCFILMLKMTTSSSGANSGRPKVNLMDG